MERLEHYKFSWFKWRYDFYKRLHKNIKENEIPLIINIGEINIEPMLRPKLYRYQCISIDIEILFSMLWNVLRENRNILRGGAETYVICQLNKGIII